MKSKELRAQRAKLIEDARALIGKPDATAEDEANAGRMMDESDAIMARITQAERSETLFAELGTHIGNRAANPAAPQRNVDMSAASQSRISNALRAGRKLSDADKEVVADVIARDSRVIRAHMLGSVSSLSEDDRLHIRNAASTSGSAGGYTIAPLFQTELLQTLKAFGGMRQAATVIHTDTGATMTWPAMDDTANTARIIAESATIGADTDLAFSQKTLGAYKYVSGYLPVNWELLQDSAFDFPSMLNDAMSTRVGRVQNTHFTTGDGSSKPTGVITAASLGTTGASGQTLTVTWQDFVKLEGSVDPAYRVPGCAYMMNDATRIALKLLVDGQNRPLFQPGITSDAGDTINGYPIIINQSMPSMAANAKSILFGNFKKYMIRDTGPTEVVVLREQFALNGQIAWLSYLRSDGNLISGGAPVKWYANSAS